MFARMLIPATPFLLILVEDGIRQLPRLVLQIVVLAVFAAAFLYCPKSLSGTINVAGIRNEWFFYKYRYSNWASGSREKASVLRRHFEGLPVRLSFYGGQARLIYYLRAPVAVECEAGLTDYFTARLPLKKRGMVGHEKKAPLSYMIHERRLHFTLEHRSPYHWNREIPYVPIDFGSVQGRILHWDPDVLTVLKARGAKFPDFISELDSFISEMNSLPAEDVIAQYRRFKNFYFDFVSDPEREKKFREIISGYTSRRSALSESPSAKGQNRRHILATRTRGPIYQDPSLRQKEYKG